MQPEQRRRPSFVRVLLLTLASCGGDTVSVGSEWLENNGSPPCLGTACTRASGRPLILGEGLRCPEQPSATLTRAFEFEVQARVCKNAGLLGCNAQIQRVRAAPDGSVWLTSSMRGYVSTEPEQNTLWLGHIGPDGADLGFLQVASISATPDTDVLLFGDLALDAEGKVYVVSSSFRHPIGGKGESLARNALLRCDRDGCPMADVIPLTGMRRAQLAIAADGRLVLAGHSSEGDHGVVTALESDGRLAWSQPNVTSIDGSAVGVFQLALDARGGAAVYSMRPRPDASVTLGVTRLDAQGAVEWDRFVDGPTGSTLAAFGMDAEGNSTFVVIPTQSTDTASPGQVASLDANGELRWRYDVASAGSLAVAPGGDVFLRGGSVPDPALPALLQHESILRIVADGSRCERYSYPGFKASDENVWQSLVPGPDGTLYIVSPSALGRLEQLPAD